MDSVTLLIAGVVFIIVFLWFQRTDPNLPPSPRRPWPLLGHLSYLSRDTRTLFRKWWEDCGDIFSIYMGSSLTIVVSGYNLIKEGLVKKADALSSRPPFFIDQASGIPAVGVIFSSGELWKEQRSVALSILRAFGMGKNILAQKIEGDVVHFINYLKNQKGVPTDIRMQTNISVSNIICSILMGQSFDYDDVDFLKLMHAINCIAIDQQNVSLINFFPWLKYLPGDLFLAKKIEANVQSIINMMRKFIHEKKTNIYGTDEPSNLIEAYFIERNKKVKAGISTTLDDNGLIKIMNDLFEAGTETTSTTILWCILYTIHNPKVQENIYHEIKEKIGTHRAPTIQDKTQLIYLNAVIMETQRLASIVPLSVPHLCTENISLGGYTIPKGATVLPNLDSVLHDKAIWGEDAMIFRPERFIDGDGKIINRDEFIPFSSGRRVCIGEALAKMELFLFLSSIYQKFKLLPETAGSYPPLNYVCGSVAQPVHYKVRAVERS